MGATEASRAKPLPIFAAALFACGLALYLRPYIGIRHDATLYLGQALLVRFPETFAQDLFFNFGSQASYTIFPSLIASALDFANVGDVFLWGALLGRIVFWISVWVFIRTILPHRFQYFALLAAIIMPSGYGGFAIFNYGEAFFTARPFAEGLVLLGLAALIRQRPGLCLITLAMAGLLHPLPAIIGAGVAWVHLFLRDRRWLHLAWLVLPVFCAAFFGLAPFDKLLLRFDSAWLAIMAEVNDHIFPSKWPTQDWIYWATDLYLLYRVRQSCVAPIADFATTVALSLVLAMSASLLLGDVLQLALPTGLQLWRVQWIVHLMAMIALPLLFTLEYRKTRRLSPRLLLLAAIVLVGAPLSRSVSWANLALIPLHFFWPRIEEKLSPSTQRIVWYGALAAIALHAVRYMHTQWAAFDKLEHRLDLFRLDVLVAAYPLVAGALVVGALLCWRHAKPRWQLALTAAAAVFASAMLLHWDARNDWAKYVERAQFDPALFGPHIEQDAQVYWEDELLGTWLTLGRASYYNSMQQAGQMFNRDTAIEAGRRERRAAALNFQANLCTLMESMGDQSSCFISRAALEDVCRPEGPSPPPTYLVLTSRQPEPALGKWVIPASVRGGAAAHYYLYRCTDIIRAGGSPEGNRQ